MVLLALTHLLVLVVVIAVSPDQSAVLISSRWLGRLESASVVTDQLAGPQLRLCRGGSDDPVRVDDLGRVVGLRVDLSISSCGSAGERDLEEFELAVCVLKA